jgi:alanyl-tRNA synthetase
MSVPHTSEEIRQAFLDFFNEQKHTVVPSSPLPNRDNPTLLFTNAGMNQFANIFLGKVKRPYPRATTAQKVMRVQGKQNDLENVGPSPRHHTMFEMLGNFSFGDYFKAEAIEFAWMFVTDVLQMDKDRLWATVYLDDDEAFELWERFLPRERILRFDEKENFWEMGDTGPCGPCSEIHYYIGPLEDQTADGVNYDDHYLEIWNLVFMQFERQPDGSLNPLPNPSVDTGMGLERVAQAMQDVDNNYDTDLFSGVLDRIQALLGHVDDQRAKHLISYRVIADHGRAATFLIADGVVPGNVGEGYVLRMIIRRAARFGRKAGFTDPFLAEIAQAVSDKMGEIYPEVRANLTHVKHVLTTEEERFNRTLDAALERLEALLDELEKSGEDTIPGDTAFEMYATYGLPLEITRDVAGERGFNVDEDGFRAAQEAHAIASGAGAFKTYDAGEKVYSELLEALIEAGRLPATGVDYDPYSGASMEAEILGLVVDGNFVEEATIGTTVELITGATPFYVEAGGEVSDTGWIRGDGFTVQVTDTVRPIPGIFSHVGHVESGTVSVGQNGRLEVDNARRADIRRNHTATHLLHHELRAHLGDQVHQAGSLVAPDRLRFDFTHAAAVDRETLAQIETGVNESILRNFPVEVGHMKQKEAIAKGAMALFGEKYGDIVRTICIGCEERQDPYSFELCGGLHVAETGEIGQFRFVSEGAVAAGIRRVEAVTGFGAYRYVSERLNTLEAISSTLNAPADDAPERVATILNENRALKKELETLRRQQVLGQYDQLMASAQSVDGATVVAAKVAGADPDGLRALVDRFRNDVDAGVILLATLQDDRPVMVAGVTDALVARGAHAGNLVRDIAKMVGGGGGGRPHLAQAGGKDSSKLAEALDSVPGRVAAILTS